MVLKTLNTSDIKHIQTWFSSVDDVKVWGGPDTFYPFSEDEFIKMTKLNELPTYGLYSDENECVGFGQYFNKLGRCHLARLIISPKHRGKGYAKVLIFELLKRGEDALGVKEASLYVLKNNIKAYVCYVSMGFVEAETPTVDNAFLIENCAFMIKKL